MHALAADPRAKFWARAAKVEGVTLTMILAHPNKVAIYGSILVEQDKKQLGDFVALGEVPGLNYVHDLAVTPSWYIVQMTPFVEISPSAIKKATSGKSAPYSGDGSLTYPILRTA